MRRRCGFPPATFRSARFFEGTSVLQLLGLDKVLRHRGARLGGSHCCTSIRLPVFYFERSQRIAYECDLKRRDSALEETAHQSNHLLRLNHDPAENAFLAHEERLQFMTA